MIWYDLVESEVIKLDKAPKIDNNRWQLTTKAIKAFISTVFLSLDHGFTPDRPILFETCVFYKNGDSEVVRRYNTQKEAMEGHAEIVKEYGGTYIDKLKNL